MDVRGCTGVLVTPVFVHSTGKYQSAEADFFKFLDWSKTAIEGRKT